MLCPCGSKIEYKQCCEPIIDNCKAKSPEQLMRSRFSAYTLQCYHYVFNTYCSSSKKTLSLNDIASSADQTKWLNLRIIKSSEFKFKQNQPLNLKLFILMVIAFIKCLKNPLSFKKINLGNT